MRSRAFLALGTAALMSPPAEAVTRCVRPEPYPGCFPSIQAAVDESIPGDVINLAPGVYFENVNIPAGKDGLKISGAGKLTTIIDPDHPLTGNAFTVGSNGVKIRNLGIRNGQAHGILLDEANGVLIQGVRIVGLRGALSAGISGAGDDLQILNNEIRSVGDAGIHVVGDDIVVTSNSVSQARNGIEVEGSRARVASNRVTAVENGMFVVEPIGSGGATVTRNTIELATSDGLGVDAYNPTVQANNLIHGEEYQIGCGTDCTGGSFSGNTSLGSRDFGVSIYSDGQPGFVLRGNRVSWSSGPAFRIGRNIEAVGNSATDAGVFGNHDGPDCFSIFGDQGILITRNTATRCAGSGFRVTGSNAALTGNTSNQTGVDGFTVTDVFAEDNILTGNRALSSNAAGFAIVGAIRTSLSGNTASRNRYGLCDDGTDTALGQNSFGTPPTSSVCDVVQ